MEARQIISSRTAGWRISVAAGPVLAVLSITGCASFWDDVTSRDFKVKSLFVQPDPLQVLQTTTDGDVRAKALRALKEPISHGGTQADQDEVMKLVTAAAVSDKQPICRLAAMQALGRFKDQRAATALVDSFYRANSFAADTTSMLRCHALKCLGETGNASAVELLVRVVREPRSDGTETERQNAMDVRLAAARALGHYSDPQAEAALFTVMRTEKDIGLRMCAYEALRTTTGKKMPLESKEWDDMPQLAAVSLPPTGPATSPFAGDAKPNPTPTPSLLTPVVTQPAMTVPSNIQPASIQPTTTTSPAGLPPTPVIVPSSMSSKP
ncbi:MAG TPA: HEAT repeat domain-containing protein [Gemmataceae bacterium]|nr:HEAT repeat domain-containing protein [Gemmataceae bacterium]